MNPLTIIRPEPYVWVSWITKLLAGEASCTWSVWLRAHYQTAKVPSKLELGTWQMDHASLLRKAVTEYETEGLTVFAEGQNLFTLKGKTGTLSGKPDVVAVKGKSGWIIDTKTGSPKASDRVQVMVYMWALPKTNPAFAGVRFDGKVVYRTRYNLVHADEVDETFAKRVGELMKEVCGEIEPHKAPSYGECQFCPVTTEDCPDRVEMAQVYAGVTDEF
jgi:hypothetical protein